MFFLYYTTYMYVVTLLKHVVSLLHYVHVFIVLEYVVTLLQYVITLLHYVHLVTLLDYVVTLLKYAVNLLLNVITLLCYATM